MPSPLFAVDEDSGIPIWIQLRNRLMYLIDSNYYSEGDRLPTVRSLAADINVNYHTVNKVYTSLEYDGYISSKRGRGAFVCRKAKSRSKTMPGDAILSEGIRQCRELGMSFDDIKIHFTSVLETARALADEGRVGDTSADDTEVDMLNSR